MSREIDIHVSVIIPCYNVEDYIIECLESVYSQTYKNIEIICVNDGSTDRTEEVLKKYSDKAELPFTLINTPNQGAPHARNIGLRNAKGVYIQFLDADDLLMPDKLSNQMMLYKNNHEPGLIVGAYIRQQSNGMKNAVYPDERSPWFGIIGTRLGITSSNLWKRQAVVNVGLWNEELNSGQEYDLMFRLLQNNSTVVYDSTPFTIVRTRDNGSISRTNRKQNHIRYINLRVKMYRYLKENKLLTSDLERHMHRIIFKKIQQLYRYSKEDAVKMHNEVIPKSFRLDDSIINYYYYRILYLIFGFEVAQKVWSVHMKFKKYIYHLTKERVES